MTTIDPRNSLPPALQARLAGVRERVRAQQPASAAAVGQGQGAGMAQRLQVIDPHDPDRRRKAVRLYLECELAREFGEGLRSDAGFPLMLDAVQQQMQDDPQTAAAVHALGDLLLSGIS